MNEQNKNQNEENAPKTSSGAPVSQSSSWKKLLSKRWVYPAAYIAAAAIILTLVWVYQDASMQSAVKESTEKVSNSGEAVPTTGVLEEEPVTKEVEGTSENLAWPVATATDVNVVKPFYDSAATTDEKALALLEYDQTFIANAGIDLARADDQTFEVKAALSGKVTRVEQHPLNGMVVEITHDNDLKTVYQSVADVKVKQNDEVKQGDTIAISGKSELGKDLGNHVHFEVYEAGKPVNPEQFLKK
ncbi:M23 family metallopeptidase [Paenibacillus sp. Marseille-Q4541]|uniref:M23 family metallopeptidase n=1 Tax=Paenibacillus sp. Marseille-Q4541 TaxID=2831522 RepID=UPI001BA4BD07|nr:M23 family metallopeptidase [Paenibacillus sp. Marseille-Q4541]